MTAPQERDRGESPVKQALREIRRLREELTAERARRTEPLAIVGIGVRFPGGADTPAAFWNLLANGVDAVGPIPRDRWPHEAFYDESADAAGKYYVQRGGFLPSVDGFDPEFFGIAPVEALTMDPQQRLLLETVWEALEEAAIPATSLQGTRTGVFVGIGATDYHRLVMSDPRADTYASTGTLFSVAAGRLSYVLGLTGPAIAVDTACSSSLVAVHLACQSLRSGESDVALAAGVNLMLSPELTVNFCRAGMLSRDGRCKTFDADADGYVRSEGCGVVVLKRVSDAVRDGDRIHAVVRGSAINQDGRSSGLTAPNGPSQEAVLRSALRDAALEPDDIDYVEAHGTGTSLGDPIEVQAIGAVFGAGRPAGRPLMIGSLKTNLGHLESAAGIAGLIKVALSLEHGELPPHLHFRKPNPHIPWSTLPVTIPTTLTPCRSSTHPRRAGVSSFGFSGTNAHVVLEAAPASVPGTPPTRARSADLLVLSAPDGEGLRAVARRYAEFLSQTTDSFADVCATTRAGRAHLSERLAVVAGDAKDASNALLAWLDGRGDARVRAGRAPAMPAGALAFVFGDSEAIDPASVRLLAESSSAFREALDACGEILRSQIDVPLTELLWSDDRRDLLQRPGYAHPVLLALACAQGAMWRSLGAEPVVVAGDGIGEIAAAHLAGVHSLEDALRLALVRGRALETSGNGATRTFANAVEQATREVVRGTPRLRILSAAADTLRADDVRRVIQIGGRPPATPNGFACWIGGALGESGAWRRVLDGVAALYLLGETPVASSGVRRDAWHRVTLPTYPFQRRRFWYQPSAEPPSAVIVQPAANVAPAADRTWQAAVDSAAERASLVPMGMNLGDYAEGYRALAALTELLVRNALASLGAFGQAGVECDVAEVLRATGIKPLYTHIVERGLEALVRAGVLERTAKGFRATAPLAAADTTETWSRVERALATDQPLVRYVRHAASLVPDVLSGRVSALETLFPGGSFELAAELYHDATFLRYVNGIGAGALRGYVNALPAHARVRVLEIGAGTGGTTASLLKVLPPDRSEYVYTDVSDIFLEYAAERFGGAGIVRTQLFDLEKDAAAQGVAPGTWDVVVAANVVHAARDIRKAVRSVRELLAPGGLLLLVESTGHHAWHDISVGLIEGWQHFEDNLRTDTPLLTPDVWASLLRDEGFAHATAYPLDGSPAALLKQHVVMALAPEEGARPAAANVQAAEASVTAIPIASTPAREPAGADGASPLAAQIASAPADEREEIAAAAVRDCVIAVLRSDPNRPPARDARLLDVGLDSLMAVRLRNMLQKKLQLADPLPSTLVFDFPTIRHIARLIVKRVAGDAPVAAPAASPVTSPTTSAADLAGMTEAQVEAMLLERLTAEGAK